MFQKERKIDHTDGIYSLYLPRSLSKSREIFRYFQPGETRIQYYVHK